MTTDLPFSRRVIRQIAALSALILAVVLAGGGAMLLHTARAIDMTQAAEERALVQRRFERGLEQMVSDVTSASIWNEAYLRLGPSVDGPWADENVGRYYDSYLGHTNTAIVAPDGLPVYYWRGERRPVGESLALLGDAAPLIQAARQKEAQIMSLRRRPIGFRAVATARGLMESGGAFYLVAVSTVVPETAEAAWRPSFSPLIISVKQMDARFLNSIARDLRLADVAVHRTGPSRGAALPLLDAGRAQIGEITWTPKTPGFGRIQDVFPVLMVAMLVLLLAALGVALHIRAVMRQLAANDAALDHAMQELIDARDEAAKANRAKSQFLANMSHEIRTPLNGVLGMAQVMERDELTPRQLERLRIIRESGRALLVLLNDILDVSKIEAGRLELEETDFDLEEIVRAACALFAEMAEQKGLAMQVQVAPQARGRWRGDPLRLRQVISNLVSNAVKFTVRGSVSIEVERSAEGLAVRVRDTGVGIPAARLGGLFEKFTQVDASTSRQYGGTGLGLAISRELTELMKGSLTVESEVGVGSTFTMIAPLDWVGPPAAAVSGPESEEGGEGELRILAVEDNVTNQVILQSLLAPLQGSLTLVANGMEAVEAVRSGRYELVLMDIQMPQMNGVEATRAIRRWEAANNRRPIPILAVTANVLPEQVEEYLNAGMTGFISKPIESRRLIAAMTEAVEAGGRS
jgi:two-component system, sensor histidine kinase